MALLMLSFASVQSIVMKVVMAPSGAITPLCTDEARSQPIMSMAGMDMRPAAKTVSLNNGHKRGGTQGYKTACPYCAAAAHTPIIGQATPLSRGTGFVFTAFRVVSRHGPRGPPALQPRARGPPLNPLIA
jgi:hypothetical protein